MKTFFTFSGSKRPMMIFFAALSLLAACKKDHNDSHVAPVTSPLSVVAAKAGDTIRIQGTNFTTDANQVKVSFNGVAGTVVSVSDTEIVVIVPEGAATGNVTVTVYENTVQAGSLTINLLTFYSEKATEGNPDSYQLISLNPSTLAETVIFNLNEVYNGASMQDIVYLPTTNEVVGLDRYGWTLIKINVGTKQKTTFELTKEYNITFDELVLDNANNLYAMKAENGQSSSAKYTLVKLDAATGKVTDIKPWQYAYSLTYLPSSNQIVGMNMASRLTKYNLATGDTSTLQLSNSTIEYHDLWKDNKSTLYALKTNYNTKVATIIKLDPVTLAETVVTTLSNYNLLWDVTFIPQRNEFVGIWNDQSFYRYNLGTNQTSVTALTSDPKIYYGYVEGN